MGTIKNSEVKVRAIAHNLHDMPGALLPILHRVQNEFGYLPKDSVPVVASELNLSRAEVHGVISFYHDFRQEPPASHIVEICRAEACQAVGARALQEKLELTLSAKVGHKSPDGNMMLKAVYCLGNCACGPNIKIDGKIHGRVSADRVAELLSQQVAAGEGKIE